MTAYLLQLVAWTGFMAALILWPAGTVAFPAAWALIALFAAEGLITVLWLRRYSPNLLRERMRSPIQRAQKPWDRVWLLLFIPAFLAWLMIMGWDAARTGFNAMPTWLQVLGGVAFLVQAIGVWATFRANAFAAPVVKIQSNQRVIDTGPYAIIRHPMYTSMLFFFLGIPLLLGSWCGLILAVPLVLAMAWRAVREERVLRAELAGYDAYAARVRYRLVPGLW